MKIRYMLLMLLVLFSGTQKKKLGFYTHKEGKLTMTADNKIDRYLFSAALRLKMLISIMHISLCVHYSKGKINI